MTPNELTAYLYNELPLASALGLKVLVAESRRVVLTAPFGPNRNGHGTAFGGSLATLGILAGWAMVYAKLREDGLPAALVIQKSLCEYRQPIRTDITIEAGIADADWQEFVQWFARHQKARVTVVSSLRGDGEAGAIHTGTYVALARGVG